jgi:hypothetical protein
VHVHLETDEMKTQHCTYATAPVCTLHQDLPLLLQMLDSFPPAASCREISESGYFYLNNQASQAIMFDKVSGQLTTVLEHAGKLQRLNPRYVNARQLHSSANDLIQFY